MERRTTFILLTALACLVAAGAWAGEAPPPTPEANAEAIAHHGVAIDIVWTLIAAFLVFFMQAGFAMVEAGFTRAKNACNILMKNLMDFSVGSLAYWAIGFGLMFGATKAGLFGTSRFFLAGAVPVDGAMGTAQFQELCSWMFQVVFAAT